MDEGPEKEASAKLAQHLAVAVQIAEAVIRMRQQQTEQKAVATEQAAAATRAQTTAQHTADRTVYGQALDPQWTAKADLHDLGRAWGAAAGWADTDPVADVAAARVETRLTEMAPASMARFHELRETGTDRIEAMRDVLAGVAAESSYRPRVFVAEPAQATTDGDAQARADTASFQAGQYEATPDDLSTPTVDEHAEGVRAGTPRRDEQGAWQSQAADAAADAAASAFAGRRTTETGQPHPGDVAADSFPRPYTAVTPASTGKTVATTTAVAAKTKTRTLSR